MTNKRFINVATLDTNASPCSTQVWTDSMAEAIAVMEDLIARGLRRHGQPVIFAVIRDTQADHCLRYTVNGLVATIQE